MKKLISLLVLILLFCSCQGEKSKLYDKACDKVKELLKAPGTAKFESYDEALVLVNDNAGSGNPFKELNSDTSEIIRKYNDTAYVQYDNTPYSLATVKVNYEAQNSFGVPMKSAVFVTFKKWNWKSNSKREWQFITVKQ